MRAVKTYTCIICHLNFQSRYKKTCSRKCLIQLRRLTWFGKKRPTGLKGSEHPNWKGDKVGYNALHQWVKRRFLKPGRCSQCGKEKKWLDLANISQKYKRDLSDWEWLCRKCHMEKDGRMSNWLARHKARILPKGEVQRRMQVRHKAYREQNKERIKAYMRSYWLKSKPIEEIKTWGKRKRNTFPKEYRMWIEMRKTQKRERRKERERINSGRATETGRAS